MDPLSGLVIIWITGKISCTVCISVKIMQQLKLLLHYQTKCLLS